MKLLPPALALLLFTSCNSMESTEEFSCSVPKNTCAEMGSCREARFYLETCGVKTMDGDSDNIPCEVEHCRRY